MSRSKSLWLSLAAFAAGVLLASSAFAQPLGWHQMPGAANDIGVGADGTAWVIGNDHPQGIPNDYHIYRLVNGNWQAVPGWAVRVAVGPRGDAWVINSTHNIFHWNGSGWDNNPGTGLDIGVGANGDVWLIGTDHAIWKWDPVASWQKKTGAADRIAVGPTGTPWVVNSSHQIFYSPNNGASWVNVPGGAIDIGAGSEGSVWIVGNDGSVWKYLNGGWSKADGGLTNITVDNHGNPWGVNYGKQIWAATAGAQFTGQPVPGACPRIVFGDTNGSNFGFGVRNGTNKTLWVTLYDFGPFWYTIVGSTCVQAGCEATAFVGSSGKIRGELTNGANCAQPVACDTSMDYTSITKSTTIEFKQTPSNCYWQP